MDRKRSQVGVFDFLAAVFSFLFR